MTATHLEPLENLARAHGVQLSYLDMAGRPQAAKPETLRAVLAALGVAAETPQAIQRSLAAATAASWKRGLDPVRVAWDHRSLTVDVRLRTEEIRKKSFAELTLEDGTPRSLTLNSGSISTRTTIDGKKFVNVRLTLPGLPFGYHSLEVQIGERRRQALILSAPTKSYSRPGIRDWGIFLPLYAAHSKRSWGAGNFSDWENLCTWLGSLGGKLAGTLPLLANFLDHPKCDPSPYSPASRLFWNEFYLDVERIPEFAACADARKLVGSAPFQKRIATFRREPIIDYSAQWKERRKALERLARFFFSHASPRRAEFENFLRERPEVKDYARFRATCDRLRTGWQSWPERLRHGDLREGDFDPAMEAFHLYTQWLAQQQMNGLIKHCAGQGVELYLDLPLGVHPDGYDVWREQECFARRASVGAPPDVFFTNGQNWGFSPLHPQRIREQGYRHLIDFLRFQMRHTGMLRIDHVMSLHRLYWIPQGCPATDGAYVSYPADEWLAILSLESHRQKTILVGENLGTVPREVNESMARHGLRGMYVLQFEQRPNPTAALGTPAANSVASLNTHDMPPFAAHWKGLDIAEHSRMGWIPQNEIPARREARQKLNRTLARFLKKVMPSTKADLPSVLKACLAWLGRSRAEVVLVTLEDLLFEQRPQNTPGTYREYPNWRRKLKLPMEQLLQQPKVLEILRRLDRSRKSVPKGRK